MRKEKLEKIRKLKDQKIRNTRKLLNKKRVLDKVVMLDKRLKQKIKLVKLPLSFSPCFVVSVENPFVFS